MTKTIEIEPCAKCLKIEGRERYPYLSHIWHEDAIEIRCIMMDCGNAVQITQKDAISSDGAEIVLLKWNAKQK